MLRHWTFRCTCAKRSAMSVMLRCNVLIYLMRRSRNRCLMDLAEGWNTKLHVQHGWWKTQQSLVAVHEKPTMALGSSWEISPQRNRRKFGEALECKKPSKSSKYPTRLGTKPWKGNKVDTALWRDTDFIKIMGHVQYWDVTCRLTTFVHTYHVMPRDTM